MDQKAICAGGLGIMTPINSELLQITTEYSSPQDDLIVGFGEARFDNGKARDDRKIAAAVEKGLYRAAGPERARLLKEANKWYADEFLARLWDAGLRRHEIRFSSTSEDAQVAIRLDKQTPPAPPDVSAYPVTVQLHPIVVSALANRSIAGKTYTDKQMEDAFTNINRVLNLPALPKTDDVPWSVTLAGRDPLTLKIEGNTIVTTLRGQSYTSGENKYNGMNVTSRYRVVRKAGELRLVRDEELEVLPPDFKPGDRLGLRQEVLRSLLRRRFGRLLPKDIPFRDLHLPEAAKVESSMQINVEGSIQIRDLLTTGGWLTLGLGYKAGASK